MKKLLTVSLVAVMAVSAAHAQIASVEYVKGEDVLGLTGTQTVVGELDAAVVPAIKALQGEVAGLSGADGAVAGALADAKAYADQQASAAQGAAEATAAADAKAKADAAESNAKAYAEQQAAAAKNGAEATAAAALSAHVDTADGKYETKTDANAKLTEAKEYTDAAAKAGTDGKLGSGFVKTYVDDKVGTLGEFGSAVDYVDGRIATLEQNIDGTNTGLQQSIEDLGNDITTETERATAAENAIVTFKDGKVDGGLISEMDLTQTGGQYVKFVKQEDGKVSAEGASFAEALTDAETNAPQAKVVKSYTDTAIKNLTALSVVPEECQGATTRCALIATGGNLDWEVVEY